MPKQIEYPAKLLIVFGKEGDVVSVQRMVAKVTISLDEYPDLPKMAQVKHITLTPAQETTIKNFCKNVVIPQL